MRPYSKLTNGAWREKRCNDFNVKASKVQMPQHVVTRITTILKRMPKDKTLGDLVDEGHASWLRYDDMGKTCQEYLMAAINAVAGEQVLAKHPNAKPIVDGLVRKTLAQQIRERMDEQQEKNKRWQVIKNVEVREVPEQPMTMTISAGGSGGGGYSPQEVAQKLADKYRVTHKTGTVYTAHSAVRDVPVDPEHIFDDLSEGQLRAKCTMQMKQLWKMNKENSDLRRELADLKERLAKLAGV